MTELTKKEALAKAKADFHAKVYGTRYVFKTWGGTTGYMAERDGIHLVSRSDAGGIPKGYPNRLAVSADNL
jgi:hypothetical protein